MMRICIFCEGDTEKNYIQALNRLLRAKGVFDVTLTSKHLEGVSINNYFQKIKKHKAYELKYFTHFYAWLDFDIFKRANKNKREIENRINKISFNKNSVESLFNYMNGEDFIILHEGKSKIKAWKNICEENNHFDTPMHSKRYLPLFKTIKQGYKKGDVPELKKVMIRQYIDNINDSDIPFVSGAKKILEIILKQL